MKIAIMQPYVFPYLGYFQLINAVDKFIFFDDVGFIKQGWINRNNILLNKSKHRFTIPIQKKSSNKTIRETQISKNPHHWNFKLLNTIRHAYQNAPYFKFVFPIVESILKDCIDKSIGDVAINSIEKVLEYIGVVQFFGKIGGEKHLKLSEKIVDICKKENATTYINAIGGQAFLSKNYFETQNIELKFLKANLKPYKQSAFSNQSSAFFAGLSIIDVLMYNSVEMVREMLEDYTLI